jgi:hypothetical protein
MPSSLRIRHGHNMPLLRYFVFDSHKFELGLLMMGLPGGDRGEHQEEQGVCVLPAHRRFQPLQIHPLSRLACLPADQGGRLDHRLLCRGLGEDGLYGVSVRPPMAWSGNAWKNCSSILPQPLPTLAGAVGLLRHDVEFAGQLAALCLNQQAHWWMNRSRRSGPAAKSQS